MKRKQTASGKAVGSKRAAARKQPACRPRVVGEWRASDAELLAQMALTPLQTFPPGLCPLIASFVSIPFATVEQVRAQYRMDPGCAIRVAVRIGPFRVELATVARFTDEVDDELACTARLRLTAQLPTGADADGTADGAADVECEKRSSGLDFLLDRADTDTAANQYDVSLLRHLLRRSHMDFDEHWIRGDAKANTCECEWNNPSITSLCASELARLRVGNGDLYALPDQRGRDRALRNEDERILYAVLWMNAFPASAYLAVPARIPIATANVLAANRRLALAMDQLLSDLERPDLETTLALALEQPHTAAMAHWPIRINSRRVMCSGLRLLYMGRAQTTTSLGDYTWGNASEVPICAQAAAEERWWPCRKLKTALYRSFVAVLERAVAADTNLVGLGAAALRVFCGGLSPPIAASDDLVGVLVTGLNFEWRRPGDPQRGD